MPVIGWAEDWRLGEDPELEESVSSELIAIFSDFWAAEAMEARSRTTRQRYSGALHALGGHILEQTVYEGSSHDSVYERLWAAVEDDEGPLIFLDNEVWQRELDTACRKLRKYLLDRSRPHDGA